MSRYSLLLIQIALCIYSLQCASARVEKANSSDMPSGRVLDCSDAKALSYPSANIPGAISISDFLDSSPVVVAHSALLKKEGSLWNKATLEYSKKNFVAAKATLQALLPRHENDLYLKELYARAWYWTTGNRKNENELLSFYLDLKNRIQAEIRKQDGVNAKGELNIVSSFTDVEWKIATIYLDRGEWQKADSYLDISLLGAISSGLVQQRHPSVIENYAYLAEASFFLKNKAKNHFYLCKTLQMDPENTYVGQFALE